MLYNDSVHRRVNHSDRNGMHMVIDIKRDASPQIVLNQLYSFTQMQTTFGVIMLAIVNGEPKTLHWQKCSVNILNSKKML